MKKNKTLITGAITLSLLAVIGGATVFAAGTTAPGTITVQGTNEQPTGLVDRIPGDDGQTAEQRREEMKSTFSIYEKYGLTYDEISDAFFYNGKQVRYFCDTKDKTGTTSSFVYDNGEIDVKAVRNNKYELTGLEVCSAKEFAQRTEEQEKKLQNFPQSDDVDYSYGGEYRDNSLNEYRAWGISKDDKTDNWLYQNKIVNILIDDNGAAFVFDGSNGGICLRVIRSNDGTVDKLVEITCEEAEKLLVDIAGN